MAKSKNKVLALSPSKREALIEKIHKQAERHLNFYEDRPYLRYLLLVELIRAGEISVVARSKRIKKRFWRIGTSRRALHELLNHFVAGGCHIKALQYGKPIPKTHPKTLPKKIQSLIYIQRNHGRTIRGIREVLARKEISVSVGAIHKILNRET